MDTSLIYWFPYINKIVKAFIINYLHLILSFTTALRLTNMQFIANYIYCQLITRINDLSIRN